MKHISELNPPPDLGLWAAHLHTYHLEMGEELSPNGVDGAPVCILLEGQLTLRVDAADRVAAIMEPGGMVQIELIGQNGLTAVIAHTDCALLALSAPLYRLWTENHPVVQPYLNQLLTARLHRHYFLRILQQLFGDLGDELRATIFEQVVWRQLQPGEILYHDGEQADDMAIVITGRLQVTIHLHGAEQILAEIPHGDIVGEMGLLTGEPRAGTVRALRHTDIVVLRRELFDTLIFDHPGALLQITQLLIDRHRFLSGARRKQWHPAMNFAVIYLSDGLQESFAKVATAIKHDEDVFMMNVHQFKQFYGQQGIPQAVFDEYLDFLLNVYLSEMETQHDYLFLETDREWTNWTKRCLQHADRVLLVAKAGDHPQRRVVEESIAAQFPELRQDLVLCHPAETAHPTGTVNWLRERNIHKHYHLRIEDDVHMARLARHLSGRAHGLVLSGGGAIGLAHIGVLQVLEEQGVPIDLIGGTSMGALIAAGYAVGRSAQEMQEFATQLSSRKEILDWTFPLVSFVATEKITRLFRTMFADVQIEDLWIPYFSVSTDLTISKQAFHERGDLWRAVRTSTAVPVAMSPVKIDDHLHVDGSVMNNFPVDKMYDLVEGGTVIGVIVSPVDEVQENITDLGDSISGWRMLVNRLNPFASSLAIPSLAETFYRSLLVNGKRHFWSVHHLVDLLISIDQTGFTFMELERHKEIINLGYETARKTLEKRTEE